MASPTGAWEEEEEEKQDCGDFAALLCTLTKYGKVDYFADSMSTILYSIITVC